MSLSHTKELGSCLVVKVDSTKAQSHDHHQILVGQDLGSGLLVLVWASFKER